MKNKNKENNTKKDFRSSQTFKAFNKNLSIKIVLRLSLMVMVFIVGFVVVWIGGMIICGSIYWREDSMLYHFLMIVWNLRYFVIPVILLIGILIILYLYCSKLVSFLWQITEAAEDVYDDDVDLIELPEELKEIEIQMNRIKLEINENKRAAKSAEQRKNDLVVYLAHDLKTPLTSVIGYLSLLRDENQISQELRSKYLSISLEKAQRLEDLINDFFEITRFSMTKAVPEKTKVNLSRMLEQLIFEFKPMLEEKNLDCVLSAPLDFMMKFDVDKMERVFDNLLRNAVNYSFEDSPMKITVTPLSHGGGISEGVDSLSKAEQVNITFENSGNTIPEEKLSRIFEQFYRLDTARTSRSGGAGLGLAIAKEIVEAHGGTIKAESKDEKITFQVNLPLS